MKASTYTLFMSRYGNPRGRDINTVVLKYNETKRESVPGACLESQDSHIEHTFFRMKCLRLRRFFQEGNIDVAQDVVGLKRRNLVRKK